MELDAKFELKPEHVKLAARVNFKVFADWEDGRPDSLEFSPGISGKRPFGNSGVTYDVAQELGLLTPEPGDDSEEPSLVMAPEAERLAMRTIIEMPPALELMLARHAFEPGVYTMERYSAYHEYREYMLAWFWLDAVKDCEDIKDRNGDSLMERAFSFTRSATGWNPYGVLDRMESWAEGTPPDSPSRAMLETFRKRALEKFRRLHPDQSRLDDAAALMFLKSEGDPLDPEWPFWDERKD